MKRIRIKSKEEWIGKIKAGWYLSVGRFRSPWFYKDDSYRAKLLIGYAIYDQYSDFPLAFTFPSTWYVFKKGEK